MIVAAGVDDLFLELELDKALAFVDARISILESKSCSPPAAASFVPAGSNSILHSVQRNLSASRRPLPA